MPPPASSAQTWFVPALTAIAVLIPLTATGVALSALARLPSSPSVPRPQHSTPPPDSTAQLCPAPALIAIAELIPLTATGAALSLLLPSPSCVVVALNEPSAASGIEARR